MSPNQATEVSTTSELQHAAGEVEHELNRLKKDWWWLLLLGLLLVLAGVVAVSYPFATSVGVVIVLGAVLLVSGFGMIITSFFTGKWSAFLLQLLVGILYVVLGFSIADSPVMSTAAITLLVGAFLIVGGIFRIVAALVLKFPQWGWALLNGVITLLLGVIIYRHFPEAGLWVIGVLVGVELIFNGLSWIMLSFDVRRLPDVELEVTES